MGWWHWILAHLFQEAGLTNEASRSYAFWSGLAGEIAVPTGLVLWVRHRNCHVKGCWRFRTHPVPGTPYQACRKHHPAMPKGDVHVEHIYKAHFDSQAQS